QAQAEIAVAVGVVLIALDGLAISGFRRDGLALPAQGDPETAVRLGGIRLELDSHEVSHLSLFEPPLGLQSGAEIPVSLCLNKTAAENPGDPGILLVEVKGLAEFGLGLLVLALSPQRQAEVSMTFGPTGFQTKGLAQCCLCLDLLALLKEG